MARDRPRAAPVSESVGHDAEASLWSERSWGGALRWRRAGPAALEPAARLGRGPIGAARPPGRAAAWGGRLGPPDPQRPAPAAGGRPNRRRPSHRQRARPSSARGVSRRTGRTSQREDRGRRPADPRENGAPHVALSPPHCAGHGLAGLGHLPTVSCLSSPGSAWPGPRPGPQP